LSLGLDAHGVIQQACFQAYGCGATIAAAEYACRWAEGKQPEQVSELTSAELMQAARHAFGHVSDASNCGHGCGL